MKKQVYEVDEQGFIVEVYTLENYVESKRNVFVDPPNGLYRARWVDGGWAEDMSQEEIDERNNVLVLPNPLEVIGMQLVQKDLELMKLNSIVSHMGIQNIKLELALLKGGIIV